MAAIAEVAAKSSEPQQRENAGNVSKRRQVVMKETPGAMRYFIARENGVASLPLGAPVELELIFEVGE